MSDQHQRFLLRLKNSSKAVAHVAQWLRDKGRTVDIPEIRFAPTAAEADQFVDHGDLIVNGQRVEVKHISRKFTCIEDWPFNEAFISNEAAVDRSWGDVVAYITVSADFLFCAVITPATRDFWYISEKLASNTGNIERFYACQLEHVKFFTLPPATPTPLESVIAQQPFLHYCHCGAWGSFGYDVNLRAGQDGRWFCFQHRPS